MNGVHYTSAIDLGAARTDTKFSVIEPPLINQWTCGPVNAIIANGKLSVILPHACQNNPNFRISMASPKCKNRPVANMNNDLVMMCTVAK